jgi:hypothetical protein
LTGFQLVATNYLDDAAVFYLNDIEVGRLRITTNPVLFSTVATSQPNPEGRADVLTFATNTLILGDNVMAVEVHQANNTSSDDVFGMSLGAVVYATNVITQTFGLPLVLNEVLADNRTLTNFAGHTADYVEIYNPSTNPVDLSDLSLSNDPNQPRKWVFPTNTAIPPLGYMLVYGDPDSPVSSANMAFGLGAKGDAVFLFHRPSAGGSLIDGIRFGLQTPDFSIGRLPEGTGNWTLTRPTPAAPNSAAGLASFAALRINEWMADPASGDDWFEIYNGADQPVALGGLFLTDDLTDPTQSAVPPLSFIGAGPDAFIRFFADGNPGAGADHVSWNLKKSGEAIAVYSAATRLIDGLNFGPQQTGVSQGRLPDGTANIVSFTTTATPAESNFLPLPNVFVNEVLSHTDPPLEDAIELFNPTLQPAAIGGWFLSNTPDNLKKFRVPDGTVVPANGFKVFYENQFNSNPGSPVGFTLNSAHGDDLNLSAADPAGNLTGFRSRVKFGAAENGVSFGRYATSAGVDFTALTRRTFGVDDPATVEQFRTGAGLPNAYPRIGPVVINEIMYHPVSGSGTETTENSFEEFLELRNITANSAPLFDPLHSTNTWRLSNAVDFVFPANITLPPDGYLLVVGFSPSLNTNALASFRTKYSVPTNVPVFGPFIGRLDNANDSVELYKPDAPQLPPHPDAGFIPFILVDSVHYSDAAPWPANADGAGPSLQRINSAAYGNDPANWTAANPSAGQGNSPAIGDRDADGIPDDWEVAHGLNPTDPNDAALDADGDGMSNLAEYLAGTDPQNRASRFSIAALLDRADGTVTIRFIASAGKSYTIQFAVSFPAINWSKLTDVSEQPATAPLAVIDPNAATNSTRFYRLVTPRVP